MNWLKNIKGLDTWSLIGLISVIVAFLLSIPKGLNTERAFIGVLGLALVFNLFEKK